MTINEYVAYLVDQRGPLSAEQVESAARILATVEIEQVAA